MGANIAQVVLFDAIVDFFDEYHEVPDNASLIVELKKFSNAYCGTAEKKSRFRAQVVRFLKLKEQVDERSEAPARRMIQKIANICIFRPAAKELVGGVLDTGDIAGLGRKVLDLEAKEASVGGGLSTSNIVDADLGEHGNRVLTHIPWIDARTGGGYGPVTGSVFGIIAPQGAGKTTLGVQLAVSQATAGVDALLALAEEGLTLSMKNKIMGCALGVDYTLFEHKSVAEVIESEKLDRIVAAKKLELLKTRLHVLDMVEHNLLSQGAQPIIAEVGQLTSNRQRPSYVYVDWAGIIARAVAAAKGNDNNTLEIQLLMDDLTGLAGRTDCIVGVSHQMSTDVVKKGPFNVPDPYCGDFCKSFFQTTKYGLVINKQDPRTGYSLMTWVKTRDDALRGATMVTQLEGAKAMFRDLSNKYMMRGKGFFRREAEDDKNKAPSERRRRYQGPDELE